MKDQEVFTDGACSGNPGPGGYAAVFKGRKLVIYGAKKNTTNNNMELKAIERALKQIYSEKTVEEKLSPLAKKCSINVTINTDSAYIVNAINQKWVDFWFKNGWKTKSNNDIKNVEIWKNIYEYIRCKSLNVIFVKVKGHSGNQFNEKADKYAKLAIKKMMSEEAPN